MATSVPTFEQGNDAYLEFLSNVRNRDRQWTDEDRIRQLQFMHSNAPMMGAAERRFRKAQDKQNFQLGKKLQIQARKDLALGTSLDPDYAAQLEQYIRAAQTARGNFLGPAPELAEGVYKGEAGLRLYQQRLANAANISASHRPRSPLGIANVQAMYASPGFHTINPNAAWQAPNDLLSYYTNAARMGAMGGVEEGPRVNPWIGAATGAMSGATMGTAIMPGVGTAVGAVAGGALGYFGSGAM